MVTTTANSTKNRRQFIRIPAHCKVTIQKILFSAKSDSEFSGEAQNISAGGLLLTANRDYHHDELVKISIELPSQGVHDHSDSTIHDDAPIMSSICQIVRTKLVQDVGYEIAAKFVDVYESDLAALKAYIDNEANRLGVAS